MGRVKSMIGSETAATAIGTANVAKRKNNLFICDHPSFDRSILFLLPEKIAHHLSLVHPYNCRVGLLVHT